MSWELLLPGFGMALLLYAALVLQVTYFAKLLVSFIWEESRKRYFLLCLFSSGIAFMVRWFHVAHFSSRVDISESILVGTGQWIVASNIVYAPFVGVLVLAIECIILGIIVAAALICYVVQKLGPKLPTWLY